MGQPRSQTLRVQRNCGNEFVIKLGTMLFGIIIISLLTFFYVFLSANDKFG